MMARVQGAPAQSASTGAQRFSLRPAFWLMGLLACAAPRPSPAPILQPPVDAGVDSEAWRGVRPKPGPTPPLVLPQFQEARLPNGLRVLVHSQRQLPLVSVLIAFSAGSAAEPPAQAGLADLTYRLLLEGAGKRGALQLAEAFSDLGATPVALVQPDGALVGTQVASRNLPAVMALLSDIVRRPALTPDGFRRRRDERLADLQARNVEPRVAAGRAFLGAVFGKDHPYGHSSSGTAGTLNRLKVTDAKAFYRRWVGPNTGALILTGDISLEEAVQWAEKAFGDWRGSAQRTPRPPPPPERERQKVLWVARPHLEQTVVMLGSRAVSAGDSDEAALEVVMAGLAGNFGSRLNLRLREDKGYSYGTGAMLDARRGMGAWLVSTAIDAKATGPALKILAAEIDNLRTHPLTKDELDNARGTLVKAMPAGFETTESTALALAGLFFEDRPLDEFEKEVSALNAVTSASAATVIQRHLALSQVQIILVGDPDVVQNDLAEGNLGPLQKVEEPR